MSHDHAMRKYYFLVAALVLLLDRVTKWMVARNLPLHDSVAIIPGLFSITHVENRGAAFGLFDESPNEWKIVVLIGFSAVALAVVAVLLWKNGHALNSTGVALSLVLGGAIGNLWDRVIAGRVTDFLLFYIGQYHWPAFNIADSAIVVGALLLVADILFAKNPHPERESVKQ